MLSTRAGEVQKIFAESDLGREAWRSLVEEPLGSAIERYLHDDLVRGLVLTDGKIGFLRTRMILIVAKRCFLYHLIGNKTGEWKVPVGGMGNVAHQLELVARHTEPKSSPGQRLAGWISPGRSRR